jgi:lantibiotic transport system ATP-binding protein
MSEAAISTSKLTRSFRSVKAVNHLELNVPKGCVYGFLGPNGAGKTTTIRLLLGLIKPDKGDIYILGKPLQKNRIELFQKIGSLVESPSFYPNLTGRENLEIICKLRKLGKNSIDEVLDLVELKNASNRKSKEYSMGMQQRLGLAIALIGKPRLLILDEPTNGLDPAGIRDIRNLIRHMVEQTGVTVFLSSHLLNEVEQIADQIGIINEGKLIFQDSIQNLQQLLEKKIFIEVDKLNETFELLTKVGHKNIPKNGTGFFIDLPDKHQIAEINKLLVNNGIGVYSIKQSQNSLEHLFLHLTNQGENNV